MINKTLITLAIIFSIAGCDKKIDSQGQEQKYHAQCAIGNVVTEEIVTQVIDSGTRVFYMNQNGKKTIHSNNCKFTEL